MAEAEVLFVPLEGSSSGEDRIRAVEQILSALSFNEVFQERDKIAIKLHVGEEHNDTHIKPELAAKAVDAVKKAGAYPFLTETSTLYRGMRSDAIHHLMHAFNNGFTYENVGAPFIMADGLTGNTEIEVPINGEVLKQVNIAREVHFAHGLVTLNHPTGHPGSGLGACIKNLGMGLASRIGKLRQHSSVKPFIKEENCVLCRQCIKWCPEDAIIEKNGKAHIIEEKCIGCGECLAVCRYDAVSYNWGAESSELQKLMTEHALGVVADKRDKCIHINFLIDMTAGCDCYGVKQEPVTPDVGLLASFDPVAVDQATLDAGRDRNGKTLPEAAESKLDPSVQLIHGEKIGLGSRSYRLKEL